MKFEAKIPELRDFEGYDRMDDIFREKRAILNHRFEDIVFGEAICWREPRLCELKIEIVVFGCHTEWKCEKMETQ